MRADRLIALVLLLQARGRMTAEDLAGRLEVSVRTIYRDLDALSAAGVPVYAECGRGGGVSLPTGYRLDLTALNKEEARALLLRDLSSAAAKGALADLGAGAVLEGALRKLAAALPAVARDEAERARQRLLVDTSDWWDALWASGSTGVPESSPVQPPLYLRTIEQAVWHDRRLRITYPRRLRTEGAIGAVDGPDTVRTVDPYALVAKRGVWYLVAVAVDAGAAGPEPQPVVFRVSRIREATLVDAPSQRPPDFDLPRFWARWCAEFLTRMPRYQVTVRVAPEASQRLARNPVKGTLAPVRAGPPDAAGWVTMEMDLEAPEVAYQTLLAYGPAVEVLAPAPLRDRFARATTTMAALYAGQTGPCSPRERLGTMGAAGRTGR